MKGGEETFLFVCKKKEKKKKAIFRIEQKFSTEGRKKRGKKNSTCKSDGRIKVSHRRLARVLMSGAEAAWGAQGRNRSFHAAFASLTRAEAGGHLVPMILLKNDWILSIYGTTFTGWAVSAPCCLAVKLAPRASEQYERRQGKCPLRREKSPPLPS